MKLCQIYNVPSAYRESIYRLLDQSFDTDWVFGKALDDIKLMDTSLLKGNVELIDNIALHGKTAYWQKGVIKYIFKPYTHYILLGEPRCLSTWIFLLISLFFPKKKIYFWSHGQYGKEGFLKKIIERLFWSCIDGGFLYGNYARNLMIKNGFKPNKLFVIHNSLAYDRQLELRQSNLQSDIYNEHFGNNSKVLIFIGRLTQVKKMDLLLEAIDILNKKNQKYNLVLIGDGDQKEHLQTVAERLHILNQVWFYGACYDEKTNAMLVYNADLCVAPGNIGLTAIHSMMFGCPALTHDDYPWQMPEFEAIKENETGGFFKRNNPFSIAEAVESWFSNHANHREKVRQSCYDEIDSSWNPYFQLQVFKDKLS